MGEFITMVDGLPIFNPEVKVIAVYNRVIKRARRGTGYKAQMERATKELAYVWFMEDYRSNFRERFPDSISRDEKVRHRLGLDEWKALQDKDIIEARAVYAEDHTTLEIDLLDTAIIAGERMVEQLRGMVGSIDPNSKSLTRTPRGFITEAKTLGDTVKELKELRREAKRSDSGNKIAKGKKKGIFEDPI